MTTETASEPVDREMLEWVAEAMDWSEPRERFGVVMADAPRMESGVQAAPEAASGSDDRQDLGDESAIGLIAAGAVP